MGQPLDSAVIVVVVVVVEVVGVGHYEWKVVDDADWRSSQLPAEEPDSIASATTLYCNSQGLGDHAALSLILELWLHKCAGGGGRDLLLWND